MTQPPADAQKREELRAWAKKIEDKMTAPLKEFNEDYSSPSSEGIDFPKPAPLSTAKRRHRLASRKRPRLRPKRGRK